MIKRLDMSILFRVGKYVTQNSSSTAALKLLIYNSSIVLNKPCLRVLSFEALLFYNFNVIEEIGQLETNVFFLITNK